MADNVIADEGAGGATFATDDIGGVHYPRTKVAWGADGTATDTADSDGARLPVRIGATIAIPVTDNADSLTVDGTVAVTHAALTELGAAINASSQMDVNIAASAATVPVSHGALTELAAAINASSQLDVNIAASAATLTVASHAVTNAGTFATQASQSGTWNIDTVTTVTDPVTVTNTGTFAVQESGAALTALQVIDNPVLVDDAAFTPATSSVMMAGFQFDDTGTDSVDEGDAGAARISANRNQYVQLRDGATGVERGAAVNANNQLAVAVGNTLTVASHAVTNAGTFAVQAAQSGTWTVQPGNTPNTAPWLVSLHDGTNLASVADLTNSNPLHVAIVDGDGTQLTSIGGGTQYAEDTVHQTGDIGTMALVVRQNSQVDLGADGDYVPMTVDDSGGLRVSIVAGAGSGGTASADDADFTAGTTSGTPAMGVYESTPTSVTDGDLGVVGITQTRALRTAVEGTVAVSNAGLTELAAAINGSSQMDVNVAAGTVAVTNAGLTELAAAINASSQMDVNIAASNATITVASHAVTNAGTFAVQVDGAALTALQVIDNPVLVDDAGFTPGTSSVMMAGFQFDDAAVDSVNEGDAGAARMSANRNIYTNIRDAAGNERGANVNASNQLSVSVDNTVTVASHAVTNAGTFAVQAAGDVAHDSADSGNPVKVGSKATNAITGITAVANNDRTQLYAGLDGVLLVRENANLESLSRGTAAITDGSSTSVISAAGSGIKTYITDVIISNSSATYVTVDIRDGTAGSVMATFPAPATSGCVHKLGSPIAGTANTAVAADPSAAASTVTVTLLGFKSLL